MNTLYKILSKSNLAIIYLSKIQYTPSKQSPWYEFANSKFGSWT